MLVQLSDDDQKTVEHIQLAFGGMSYKAITASTTESRLMGK